MPNQNQNNPGANLNRDEPKPNENQADKNKPPVEKDPKNPAPKMLEKENSVNKRN
jgi:hypothetical protein